jgi:hypothetical protein
MRVPCRPSTCSHLQCFDAATFLQMNERKPTWNCPVCDSKGNYSDLLIDGYFQEVLESKVTISILMQILVTRVRAELAIARAEESSARLGSARD